MYQFLIVILAIGFALGTGIYVQSTVKKNPLVVEGAKESRLVSVILHISTWGFVIGATIALFFSGILRGQLLWNFWVFAGVLLTAVSSFLTCIAAIFRSR
tara:strand:- start:14 stop:313 length:300 start_codon:yes stop_codon:yes gene_type:complete